MHHRSFHGLRPSGGLCQQAAHVSRVSARLAAVLLLCLGCGAANQPPPRAPGETPGAAPHYDSLVVRFVRTMGDGKRIDVGGFERPVATYGEQPVSLLIRTLNAEPDASSGGKVHVEQRFEVGGERMAMSPIDVDCNEPARCVAKEWLELELKGAGAAPRVIERVLRVRSGDGDELPGYRRYTIVALSGAVAREDVKQRIQRTVPALDVEGRRAKLDALQSEAQNATREQAQALVARMDELDAGGPLSHLVTLGFAAESDAATDALARRTGVTLQRNTPRILIAGAEARGDDDQATFSLDLRLDEVETSPSDGANAARAFQYARGIEESVLEGAWLGAMLGEGSGVSTAALMRAAVRSSVPPVAFAPADRERLEALALPADFAVLVNAALDRGHKVVLPSAAVDLAGRSRWGFWDIDPASGRTIGVMEGGQHQGMVQVPIINKEVPLNSGMGFVLGLHAGAVTGHFALAGLILKYGAVTPQLIQELNDLLKAAACGICPNATVGASVSINVGECLSEDIVDISAGANDFCGKYQDGFKCAVGILVASLEESNPAQVSVGASGPTLTIACTEISVGGE